MRICVFLDLDDTIFQTRPKCPDGEPLWPAAYRRDGTPLSFMTQQQRMLLETLFRTAIVIPTTARSLDALRRVELPFQHIRIVDFGGVVLLPDGSLDREWDDEVRPQALRMAAGLHEARRLVASWVEQKRLHLSVRVISDFDMPCYLVVKDPGGDAARLKPIENRLRAWVDAEQYFIHANDNNLSLVPRFLGKERAVRHVLERRLGPEPVLTIGMGDSLSDAPFMNLCDFSLLPRGCQLLRQPLPDAEGHPERPTPEKP